MGVEMLFDRSDLLRVAVAAHLGRYCGRQAIDWHAVIARLLWDDPVGVRLRGNRPLAARHYH